jgi:hypothetical protein
MIHQPANAAQEDLVDEMIAARWRLRRIRTIETVLLDCEMNRRKAEIEKQYVQPDSAVHLAQAFRTMSEESPSLALVSRYETRLSRLYDRAYSALRELQSKSAEQIRPTPAREAKPPEPVAPGPSSEPEIKEYETNPGAAPCEQPEKPCAHRLPAENRRSKRPSRAHRKAVRRADRSKSILTALLQKLSAIRLSAESSPRDQASGRSAAA